MFVHEKKSGLILNKRKFPGKNKYISQIPLAGLYSILQKKEKKNAAFQSSHIFMHAVHIILSTIFTSLQTLYSDGK